MKTPQSILLCGVCAVKTANSGPSSAARTHGLLVPNQARYQLRYTRIFSFFHDTTARGKIKDFSVCGHSCGQSRFYTAFGNRGKSRKRRCYKALRRFALPCSGYRHGTPKPGAIPTSLYPDIQFLPLYHGERENQRFFCLWSFMWSKPLLCRFRQSGKVPQTQVLQGFAAFRLALPRIPPRLSQTTRATSCATPGFPPYYITNACILQALFGEIGKRAGCRGNRRCAIMAEKESRKSEERGRGQNGTKQLGENAG